MRDYGAELASQKATQDALRSAGLEDSFRKVHRLLASTGVSTTDWLAPAQHGPAASSAIHNLAAAVAADGALLQPLPAATGATDPAELRLPSLDPVDGGAASGVPDLAAFNALSRTQKGRFIFERALQVCTHDAGGRFEPSAVGEEMVAIAGRYGFSVVENPKPFAAGNLRCRLHEYYNKPSPDQVQPPSTRTSRKRNFSTD